MNDLGIGDKCIVILFIFFSVWCHLIERRVAKLEKKP